MATVTVLLNKKYEARDGLYPIIVRVIHGKKQRALSTGYKAKEWPLPRRHPDYSVITSKVREIEGMALRYLAECKLHGKPIHLDLIDKDIKSYSFTEFLRYRAAQYKERGSKVMYRKATEYAASFDECFNRNIYFEEVNQDFLRVYENYLIKRPNSANTRAKKYEFLSKFYNEAINDGKALRPNPFSLYKIKTTPVKKDRLSFEEFEKLETVELKGSAAVARDLFLFSYYCKGVRFQNCIFARWDQVSNGRINFITVKGGKFVSVLIHPKLQAILDRYRSKSEYIFPYDTERESDSLNTSVGRGLDNACAAAEIRTVNFHMARHTLAWHMKLKNKSVHVIKDTLAHGDTRMTERYLQQLDDAFIDTEMEDVYR